MTTAKCNSLFICLLIWLKETAPETHLIQMLVFMSFPWSSGYIKRQNWAPESQRNHWYVHLRSVCSATVFLAFQQNTWIHIRIRTKTRPFTKLQARSELRFWRGAEVDKVYNTKQLYVRINFGKVRKIVSFWQRLKKIVILLVRRRQKLWFLRNLWRLRLKFKGFYASAGGIAYRVMLEWIMNDVAHHLH